MNFALMLSGLSLMTSAAFLDRMSSGPTGIEGDPNRIELSNDQIRIIADLQEKLIDTEKLTAKTLQQERDNHSLREELLNEKLRIAAQKLDSVTESCTLRAEVAEHQCSISLSSKTSALQTQIQSLKASLNHSESNLRAASSQVQRARDARNNLESELERARQEASSLREKEMEVAINLTSCHVKAEELTRNAAELHSCRKEIQGLYSNDKNSRGHQHYRTLCISAGTAQSEIEQLGKIAQVGDIRLLLSHKTANWFEARDACLKIGMTLIEVEDEDQEVLVKRVQKAMGREWRYWLGAHWSEERVGFVFESSGRNVTWTRWARHQPDISGLKHCVEVTSTGDWESKDCSGKHKRPPSPHWSNVNDPLHFFCQCRGT